MTDTLTPNHRSWNMSRIKGRNTSPEKAVRSLLHRMGYRFRLHRKDLPGKPDIVLPRYNTVVFVHGCFWHRHPDCKYTTTPKSNTEFWRRKFIRNMVRDNEHQEKLQNSGWRTIIVWECELRDLDELATRLQKELNPSLFAYLSEQEAEKTAAEEDREYSANESPD